MAFVQASDTQTFISSMSSSEKPILLAIPDNVSLITDTKSGLTDTFMLINSYAKFIPPYL